MTDGPRMTTGQWTALVGVTFVATLMLYGAGTLVQFLNLPLGLAVTSLFVFGAAGLFFPLALNLAPLRFTGLNRAHLPLVGLAALVALVNVPVASFLMNAFVRLFEDSAFSEAAKEVTRIFLRADPTARVLLILAAGVAAPVGEELFFRGWMQTAFAVRLKGILSVVLVAVVFSAVHGDPIGLVARIELGVLFGLARLWTGSLWPAIAMHAVHNLTSMVGLFVVDDPWAELEKPIELLPMLPWALGCAVLLWFLLVQLRKLGERARREELSPLDPRAEPFEPNLRPALTFAALVGAVVLALVVTLSVLRDTLPGHDLMPKTLPSDETVPLDAPR